MEMLLTREELCKRLRITYSTLYRWMKEGLFFQPVNGRGRKLLFDPDAVEAWITARQSPVTPTAATCPAQRRRRDKKAFGQRQAAARTTLQKHAAK